MGFHTNLRLRLEDKQNRKFLAIPWVYEFYSNRVWTRSAERIANNTPTAKIRYTVQDLLSFKEHLKQHHSLLSDEQCNAFCDLVDKKTGLSKPTKFEELVALPAFGEDIYVGDMDLLIQETDFELIENIEDDWSMHEPSDEQYNDLVDKKTGLRHNTNKQEANSPAFDLKALAMQRENRYGKPSYRTASKAKKSSTIMRYHGIFGKTKRVTPAAARKKWRSAGKGHKLGN